jgi:hypothetical protein
MTEQNFYYRISNNELITSLVNKNVYSFTKSDRDAIASIGISDYKYITAHIIESYSGCIEIMDDELTLSVGNTALIHSDSKPLSIKLGDIEKLPRNRIELENFTLRIFHNSSNLFINKGHDEWYYLEHTKNSESYKCDQIEGLLELLKNILK